MSSDTEIPNIVTADMLPPPVKTVETYVTAPAVRWNFDCLVHLPQYEMTLPKAREMAEKGALAILITTKRKLVLFGPDWSLKASEHDDDEFKTALLPFFPTDEAASEFFRAHIDASVKSRLLITAVRKPDPVSVAKKVLAEMNPIGQ